MSAERRPNVTVVGGSGFIGTRLVETLAASNFEVSVVDRAPPPEIAGAFRFTSCDVVRARSLSAVIADADIVFLLAAKLARECRADPVGGWTVNVEGTSRVLEAILEGRRRPRVVFLSSGYVYASPAARYPIQEEEALGPADLYGATKVIGEKMVAAAAAAGSFSAAVLRLFTVYGNGRCSGERGHLIARWIERAEQGRPISLDGDGRQTVDLTHVEDVARACQLVAEVPIAAGECRVFNIGSGRETEVRQIARWFTDSWPWVRVERDVLTHVIRSRQVGDIERARTELGYTPLADAEHEIKSLLRSRLEADAVASAQASEVGRPP
jgi:UDP-glucose 4-epimerase